MKYSSISNSGSSAYKGRSVNANRRKCRHLMSSRRTHRKPSPLSQLKVTSVIFSAGSNSAKSSSSRQTTSIRSTSTWRQLLTIYEEVSGVVVILKSDQFKAITPPVLGWWASAMKVNNKLINPFKDLFAIWVLWRHMAMKRMPMFHEKFLPFLSFGRCIMRGLWAAAEGQD
jgi:hypothetical protein